MSDLFIRLLMITPGIGEHIWTFLDPELVFADLVVDPPSWYVGPKLLAIPDKILIESKREMTIRILHNFCKKHTASIFYPERTENITAFVVGAFYNSRGSSMHITLEQLFKHPVVARSWYKFMEFEPAGFLLRFGGPVPLCKKYAHWYRRPYYHWPDTYWYLKDTYSWEERPTKPNYMQVLHQCDNNHILDFFM